MIVCDKVHPGVLPGMIHFKNIRKISFRGRFWASASTEPISEMILNVRIMNTQTGRSGGVNLNLCRLERPFEIVEYFGEPHDIREVSVPRFGAQRDRFFLRRDSTAGHIRGFPVNRTFSNILRQIRPFLYLKALAKAGFHIFYT